MRGAPDLRPDYDIANPDHRAEARENYRAAMQAREIARLERRGPRGRAGAMLLAGGHGWAIHARAYYRPDNEPHHLTGGLPWITDVSLPDLPPPPIPPAPPTILDYPEDQPDDWEPEDGKKKKKKKALTADDLAEMIGRLVRPRTDPGGSIWYYDDGVYHRPAMPWPVWQAAKRLGIDRGLAGQRLRDVLTRYGGRRPTVNTGAPMPYLNCRNGLISLSSIYAGAPELIPHTADLPSITQHPFSFNAAAGCPALDAWLAERADPDVIALIWEVIGQCLNPEISPKRAIYLLGPTNTGKSTLQAVITAILGALHVARVYPAQLSERFVPAQLVGKSANIVAEVGTIGNAQATLLFKAITGGDPIPVERKNKHPYDSLITAVWIMAGNNYPTTGDKTDAFFERMRIVSFDRPITGRLTPPADTLAALTTDDELAGAANRALAGLAASTARGDYLMPASSARHAAAYRLAEDNLGRFMAENYRVTGEHPDFVFRTVFRESYTAWCELEGIPQGRRLVAGKLYREIVTRYQGRVWEGRSGGLGLRGLVRLDAPPANAAQPTAAPDPEPF